MKHLKYLLFIIPFLFLPRVNAQLINSSIYMNGSQIDTMGYVYLTANEYSALKITATNTEPSGYFRVQACFDSSVTAYNMSNTSNFSNPLVVVTNTPCRYYNSSYDGGTVTNFYFDYDVSDSGAGSFTTTFNFLHFGGSFQLLSVSSSTTPYDVTSGLSDIDISSLEKQQKDILDEQKKTTEQQQKTNDTLKDDNIDTSKTNINDKSADASKSPISSLLTLPLKLLNNINTGLSGTCSSFNLGSLFGTELSLPCINLEQRLGTFLWGLIDSFFCIFLIYNVGMLAIKIWTDVIMMKDFFSQLYSPQSEKGGKKE